MGTLKAEAQGVEQRAVSPGELFARATLNVASLSIFWQPTQIARPYVGDSGFAEALLSPCRTPEEGMRLVTQRFLDFLEAKQPGALFSHSAIRHEVRHFHDILLTPAGWNLFAQHFVAVLQNLRVWRLLQQSGARCVRVPVQPVDYPDLAQPIRDAAEAVSKAKLCFDRCRICFEFLAYWVQLRYARSFAESDAAFRDFSDAVLAEVDEAKALGVGSFIEEWQAPPEECRELMYKLVLGCLGSPWHADSRLAAVVMSLRELSWPKVKRLLSVFIDVMTETEPVLGAGFKDEFFSMVAPILSEKIFENEERKRLANLVDAFFDIRDNAAQAINGENGVYRSYAAYNDMMDASDRSSLPRPRLYAYYIDNEAYVRRGTPKDLSHEFFHVKSYPSAPLSVLRRLQPPPPAGVTGPATVVLLHPVPNMLAGHGVELDPEWGKFARDLVGCTVLTEGCSTLGPVHRHWTNVMAPNEGVIIEPRRAARAPCPISG